MTRMLLLDDSAAVNELFADTLRQRLGVHVTTLAAVGDLEATLADHDTFFVAVVDLSFPEEELTGLDALLILHERSPSTLLVVITQGDSWVAGLLRDAWELLPIATVVAKTAPIDYQVELIRTVIEQGSAPPDPSVRPLLPATKSPWRSLDGFGRLVGHAGHAKLWQALCEVDEPTYRSLADHTGLRMNTIKNYRAQLLAELEHHGMHEPSMREMQHFARRCRPVLERHIARHTASTQR